MVQRLLDGGVPKCFLHNTNVEAHTLTVYNPPIPHPTPFGPARVLFVLQVLPCSLAFLVMCVSNDALAAEVSNRGLAAG